MASWSREDILTFLELYKSYECLWKVKCRDYSNRILKDKAYDQLVRFVQKFDKTANRETITKKVNSLRTTFRKEFKRVESSKTSGSGEEDVYVPKLWYYNELLFLVDQELPRTSTSNIAKGYQPLPGSSQAEIIKGETLVSGNILIFHKFLFVLFLRGQNTLYTFFFKQGRFNIIFI